MAPGGYTASICKYSPRANVSAITLPEDQGGLRIFVRHGSGTRVEVLEADITMFAAEFGITDIPATHPEASKISNERPFPKPFDLVFCDGHVARTQNVPSNLHPTEVSRLTGSQLILAMLRIRTGGALIMLLHGADFYHNLKLLRLFDTISHIQFFKPTKAHARKDSFYLVAKEMQPGRRVARAAVAEWKQAWKDATFPAPTDDGTVAHDEAENLAKQVEREKESSELIENFGARLIELGGPIWEIQRGALKALMEELERKSADSDLEESVETSEEGANSEPTTLNGLTRDPNDSSQLEASNADTLEESADFEAGATGGQE